MAPWLAAGVRFAGHRFETLDDVNSWTIETPKTEIVILAAATSGLRQSELIGLHWKHVDMRAQRIRVRNAWVRYGFQYFGLGSDAVLRLAGLEEERLQFNERYAAIKPLREAELARFRDQVSEPAAAGDQ